MRAAREIAEGRVIAVFGAGGDRDRAKRPLMGAAAAAGADVAIVTSDNPRSEDPEAIIAAVAEGAPAGRAGGRPPRRDRARASRWRGRATSSWSAGKGHEQGQEFEGGRKVPFDDVTVAREALRARVVA